MDELLEELRTAWCIETSSDPARWSADTPAWGQCAVTALVVQDSMGGDLVWDEAVLPSGERISHYWNRVDGEDIDLTREQFPEGTLVQGGVAKPGTFSSTRERVLSFPATRARYDLLKHRLALVHLNH